MLSRRSRIGIAFALAAAGLGGYMLYSVFAAQAHPEKPLAQAPMNTQVQVPAAFIMAVDDSGSMTFQNQFPAADGYACWDQGSASFFSSPGVPRTSGTSCRYAYIYPSARNGWEYHGIPPFDIFGFARSADFNPAYYDPTINYINQPWLDSSGDPYPPAGIPNTRMDPRNASPTLNLASNVQRVAADSEFFAYRGMTLPAGTVYQRERACTNAPGILGSGWQTIGSGGYTIPNNAYTQSNSTYRRGCRLYIRHWPATFFTRYTDDSDPWPQLAGTPGVYTPATAPRTRVNHACGDGCHMWKYVIQPNTTAHENFASWFTFYGNRNRAMIAGMTRALANVNNMRVGYFTINSTYGDVTMHDMASAPARSALYASMLALPASGSTPNLPAVNHLGAQFQRDDDDAPVKLACQRNAGMLFTDGFSNVASTAPEITDLGPPFDPTPEDSLAAIASQYYFNTNGTVGSAGTTPLRTDLAAGRVPIPAGCSGPDSVERRRLNCQSNLHMNFYGVTLGARGVIFDPDVDQDPFVLNPSWPGYASGNRSTIDDLWHATVNTRGEFINARTPVEIVAAMRRILASVSAGASPSGAIALSGARIGSGSLTVVPRYEVTTESDGTDWYGDLEAQQVSVNAVTREVSFGPGGWTASSKLPDPADRRIYFARGSSVLPFEAGQLSLGDLCEKPDTYPNMSLCAAETVGGNTLIEDMGFGIVDAVNYLRGDETHEGTGPGHLRRRSTSKIGDIVNSTPVISAPGDDYGYRSLGSYGAVNYGTSYGAYLEDKRSRRYMVYVGANDGMLHAFDGGMVHNGTTVDSAGGRERFAYIPATALGHMGNLLIPNDPANENDQKFQHRYYVDGPVVVSDAYYGGAGGAWHTVLVGTMGAGGRGVFALNVDNPAAFGPTDRLWEISDLNPDLDQGVRDDIGFVLGRPVIVPVRTRNGGEGSVRWVAIFGNGYHSKNGDAVLFMVDIGTGTPTVRTIRATEAAGSGVPTGRNGLGNIVVIDRWSGASMNAAGRDGFADTVYAADQRGAIWKFDLRDLEPPEPTVPLFVTQSHNEGGRTFRQPITGGIAATTGANGGVMLFFGTGSFSFEDDGLDDSQQSLYAITDRSSGLNTSTLPLNQLTRYTVGTGTEARGLSVSGDPLPFPQGWYVDLPRGERFVGYPNISTGLVFMPTYVPNATVVNCSTGGSNWLFGLNARTGAAGLSSVYGAPFNMPDPDAEPRFAEGTASVALDTGGTAPVRDVGVFALPGPPLSTPGDPADPVPDPTGRNCWMMVTVAGADPMYLPYPCGRQSWRQVE